MIVLGKINIHMAKHETWPYNESAGLKHEDLIDCDILARLTLDLLISWRKWHRLVYEITVL